MSELLPFLSDAAGQRHVLTDPSTSIGRAAENGIVVVGHRVSREHARVRRDGRVGFVHDMHSALEPVFRPRNVFETG